MAKYTEDDLKVELETKEYEYGFYTELDGNVSYWIKRRHCSSDFHEKERATMDDRMAFRSFSCMAGND